MALFKPMMGNSSVLALQKKQAGYAWFCVDDGSFHIDYVDADGNLQRKQLNAKEAETLTMRWDSMLIIDGGGANVQLAVLDSTILL